MRVRVSCLCALVLLLVCSSPMIPAADPASGSASTAKETRRKPLPNYYGKIGVTDEQREQLSALQDLYEVKIEKLRDELKQIVQERDQKLERLLTDSQRTRLQELRDAAKKKAEEQAAAKANSKAAE